MRNGDVVKRRTLSVFIDEMKVIEGDLSTDKASGELSGKYEEHKVDAVCTSEDSEEDRLEVRCLIMVDNERTVTLVM